MAFKRGFHKYGYYGPSVEERMSDLQAKSSRVESYLTSLSARAAFNQIVSELNPLWSCQLHKGQYFIAARIGIENVEGKGKRENLGFNISSNPDYLIEQKFAKLTSVTAESGQIIQVDNARGKPLSFVYDDKDNKFIPVPKI